MIDTTRQSKVSELDVGRRKARRNWARVSFYFIILSLSLILTTLLFSSERQAVAEALNEAASIINMLLGVCVMIVLGYLGFSHMDKRIEDGTD